MWILNEGEYNYVEQCNLKGHTYYNKTTLKCSYLHRFVKITALITINTYMYHCRIMSLKECCTNTSFHQQYISVTVIWSKWECYKFIFRKYTLVLAALLVYVDTKAQHVIPSASFQILLLLMLMRALVVQRLFRQTWHNLIKEKGGTVIWEISMLQICVKFLSQKFRTLSKFTWRSIITYYVSWK